MQLEAAIGFVECHATSDIFNERGELLHHTDQNLITLLARIRLFMIVKRDIEQRQLQS